MKLRFLLIFFRTVLNWRCVWKWGVGRINHLITRRRMTKELVWDEVFVGDNWKLNSLFIHMHQWVWYSPQPGQTQCDWCHVLHQIYDDKGDADLTTGSHVQCAKWDIFISCSHHSSWPSRRNYTFPLWWAMRSPSSWSAAGCRRWNLDTMASLWRGCP